MKAIISTATTPNFQPATRQAISPVAKMPQSQGIPAKNFFTGSRTPLSSAVLITANVSKKVTLIHSIACDQNAPVLIIHASG